MPLFDAHHRESRSSKARYIAIALAVVAASALGYWFFGPAPEPTEEAPVSEAPAPVVEEPAAPPPREEAPPAGDVPSTGSLSVRADVDGAFVSINGTRVGQAPYVDDEIAIGLYEIKVEKEGYQPFTEEARVRPGRRVEITASLGLSPPSLRIVSDVAGATVFLDRNYVGTTPVDVKEVTPGEHQLTVSAEGYDMYAETITVEKGHRDVNVSFKSVVLNETLAVVHKHTFGDCQGTLVADDQGLSFRTSNDKDAFSVPYGSLEQFEVDYIKKNLNVKLRQGKNYNFTEKSGNADALFVFHKNVQAYLDRT